MHFRFSLDSLDLDLWYIDLLDTHLDSLDTDIPSKHIICLQDVWKTSSRHFFKTSSRHVFQMSSRHVLKTFWRRLRRSNFSSSKSSSRSLKDFLKTSWKTKNCYAEVALRTSLRHALKTSCRRLEDQQMFAGLDSK